MNHLNIPRELVTASTTLIRQIGHCSPQCDNSQAHMTTPQGLYRCEYVALQTAVKAKCNLWMTAAEKDAIARILATCPEVKATGAADLSAETPGHQADCCH